MAAAKSVKEEFTVAIEFWRKRSRDGKDDHLEVGSPYAPVDDEEKEKYLDWGLIVPASAGSSQPGEEKVEESA